MPRLGDRRPVLERFAALWMAEPNSGCWLWTGTRDKDGYGLFGKAGTVAARTGRRDRQRAHRVSWRLHRGDLDDDLLVLHHCDNRACVNPDHLYVGTDADNVRDMDRRRRSRRPRLAGEANGNAALTSAQVAEIRSLYVGNRISQEELGRMFGVHQTQISRILLGKSWR